uniref:Transposase (Putative), gypsy type n=1 Tax=Tanacetum cinerariifolium TaxID=118510 RepID=A0A6L2L2Z5_TANCI|nr:transposase (putative), gypsy type [Tanacetum cinerariifolium]
MKSILTQSALDALCEKFHIPDIVHLELPKPNDKIRNSPTGKIGVYSRFFDFANYRIPLSQFLIDILGYFQINLSQLSVIAAAKISHFKILCRVHGYVPTVETDLFAFIHHANATKVRTGEREVREGEVPLLKLTRGRVVPLASVNDQGGVDVQGVVNEEGGDAAELFEQGTLNVEVGVTAAAMVPFVTSYVTPMPEREEGGRTNSVTGPNLRTQRAGERSSMPPPPVLTTDVATTIIANATSAPLPRASTELVPHSIFKDSASTNEADQDVAGPSHPTGTKLSTDSIFVSQDLRSMDYEQIFVEFNIGVARQTCLSSEVRLRLEHELRGKKKFEDKCAMQAGWLKEMDAEIASLKVQLSLKEAETAEAIRLHGQIANVEVAEAARVNELNDLKERNAALEGQVAALESAAASKDAKLASSNAQVAKITQDLSNLQLSCDELSIKAASLESEKDKLIDEIEAVQDEQVKVLSDKVVGLDADLMGMALHLDEEFYPRYLTTIVGRRWILSCGLRLVVIKCLQSLEYLAALGWAIGRAIDKGMQDGLAAGIDHEKARWGLTEVAAYNPAAEANYVVAMNALRAVYFPLIAQLASHKDASVSDLIDLLRLKGPVAETPEASQLQPSPDQLMLPIHRLEDQLSIFDALVPLIEPLSAENLVGEASTSGVPVTATTTALSTTFIYASTIPPVPVTDHEVSGAGSSTKVPFPSKIVFEKEELKTTP